MRLQPHCCWHNYDKYGLYTYLISLQPAAQHRKRSLVWRFMWWLGLSTLEQCWTFRSQTRGLSFSFLPTKLTFHKCTRCHPKLFNITGKEHDNHDNYHSLTEDTPTKVQSCKWLTCLFDFHTYIFHFHRTAPVGFIEQWCMRWTHLIVTFVILLHTWLVKTFFVYVLEQQKTKAKHWGKIWHKCC